MAEVQYAKSFLGLLDSRPVKLSSDYVADPRGLPSQSAYILPRMPKPYSKRARTSTTDGSSAAPATNAPLTITLKPLRATLSGPNAVTVKVPGPDSSIYDVKASCARQAGYAPDKVKILWERKPVSDSKTLKEVIGDAATASAELEMGVMFMGPPTRGNSSVSDTDNQVEETAKATTADEVAPIAQGQHGHAVLKTQDFWDDLQAFVLQRLRDEEATAKVVKGFRESWNASIS